MKLFDTHCHVNFKKFESDAEQVMRQSLDGDVGMIIVGSNYRTSKKAIELANKYEKGAYAAVGIHPIHLEDIFEEGGDGEQVARVPAEDFNYEIFDKLARLEKTVAIGEIGLDYYHLKLGEDLEKRKAKQKEVFLSQLSLAVNLGLPAIIHCRQAHDDLLPLIKDFLEERKDEINKDTPWAVMHCFSGDENLAWQYFNLGLMISFTGIITFSSQWDSLIRKMPLDRLMIETDCPFMTPEPYRGKRNEPILVGLVAERIAKIRGVDFEKIAETTTKNAEKFFKI